VTGEAERPLSTPGGSAPAFDVVAAGAVLWRIAAEPVPRPASGWAPGMDPPLELALVHRPRYDDWSLPKGKLEPGESVPAAAVREVAEETGFRARLGARLGQVSYPVPDGAKVVHYWAAEALDGRFEPTAEVDQLRWLPPDAAFAALSYQRDVEVLSRFAGLGRPDGGIALVRHGKAGSRQSWTGPDHVRPLNPAGRRQADALRDHLLRFGPDRIYSAPPLRCVQTVEPLAEALGLKIEIEPVLGEQGYWEQPDAGRRRLVEIGMQGGVNAVSSQGGVIPDVVRWLAGQVGFVDDVLGPNGTPPARKGSTWLLGLREKRLLFADHYPPPA
jgi:8-oxo-dGTP pyrophosphatase MutT (NUDIX family)